MKLSVIGQVPKFSQTDVGYCDNTIKNTDKHDPALVFISSPNKNRPSLACIEHEAGCTHDCGWWE